MLFQRGGTHSEEQTEKAKKDLIECKNQLQQRNANAFQRACATLEALHTYKLYANEELSTFKDHLVSLLEIAH